MVAMHLDRVRRDQPIRDGVSDGYQHYSKRITPRAGMEFPDIRLKWYDIGYLEFPVADDLHREARTHISSEIESGAIDATGEIGFVVLHDCGEIVFLMMGSWRGNNELWETVYLKRPESGEGFKPQRGIGDHRPTYCVWELGAVEHESRAWSRYLRSDRSPEDLQTYLSDQYTGEI